MKQWNAFEPTTFLTPMSQTPTMATTLTLRLRRFRVLEELEELLESVQLVLDVLVEEELDDSFELSLLSPVHFPLFSRFRASSLGLSVRQAPSHAL